MHGKVLSLSYYTILIFEQLIEHTENKIIAQSGLFENEVGPECVHPSPPRATASRSLIIYRACFITSDNLATILVKFHGGSKYGR